MRGWCQFGPTSEVVRIKNRRRYDASQDGPAPDWRIGCNYVCAGHRRQGVATLALEGALQMIAAAGGGRVEGYPEPAGAVPAGFLFHGALSTFERAGFVRDRAIGKHRWVVALTVEPPARRGRLGWRHRDAPDERVADERTSHPRANASLTSGRVTHERTRR